MNKFLLTIFIIFLSNVAFADNLIPIEVVKIIDAARKIQEKQVKLIEAISRHT